MAGSNSRSQFRGDPVGEGWSVGGEPITREIGEATVSVEIQRFCREGRAVEPGALVAHTEHIDRITDDPGDLVEFPALAVAGYLKPRTQIVFGLCVSRAGGFLSAQRHGLLPSLGGDGWARAIELFTRPAPLVGIELWAELKKAMKLGFTTEDIQVAFGATETGASLIRAAAIETVEAYLEGLPPKLAGRFYALAAAAGTIPTFDQADAVSPLAVEVFADELHGYVSALPVGDLFGVVAELVE